VVTGQLCQKAESDNRRTDGPTDTTDRSALVVIAMIGKHVGFDTLSQVSHTAARGGATTLLDAEHSL